MGNFYIIIKRIAPISGPSVQKTARYSFNVILKYQKLGLVEVISRQGPQIYSPPKKYS